MKVNFFISSATSATKRTNICSHCLKMGNVNARDHPYPDDDMDIPIERSNRNPTSAAKVALDGIQAHVKRVHVEGLVRTKEDVVSLNKYLLDFRHKFRFGSA